jgi:streptogramin lyase
LGGATAHAQYFVRSGLAVAVEASGDVVVADGQLKALLRRSPSAGACELLSGAGVGSGPNFDLIVDIAVESSGDLLVADNGLDAILRVDAVTGDRTVVSSSSVGSGPNLFVQGDIEVDNSGNILVVDLGLDAVLRVNPANGNRTVVSDAGTGAGINFQIPRGIAVEASGDIVVADSVVDGLIRVDPTTGNRTLLSGTGAGSGAAFTSVQDVEVDASGDLIVMQNSSVGIVRVDPVSGDRTLISANPTPGAGPEFTGLQAIALDASGDVLAAAFGSNAGIFYIDATSGERALLDCTCAATPLVGYSEVGKAGLSVSEKTAGKEKLKLSWLKVADETTRAGFGTPTGTTTFTGMCIYDDSDSLVASLLVPPGETCAGKPCWKEVSKEGWAYGDKGLRESGVAKVLYIGNAADKGKILGQAANNAAKGSQDLPTGLVAALTGNVSPTIQIVTTEGFCATATMNGVKKDDGTQYSAGKK